MSEQIGKEPLSWTGDKYDAPRVEDVTFGEVFAADLADAIKEAKTGSNDRLTKLAEAYGFKQGPLEDEDVQDWIKMGESMTSWSDEGVEVAFKLVGKGADPEKMIKLTENVKMAEVVAPESIQLPPEVDEVEVRNAQEIAVDIKIVCQKNTEENKDEKNNAYSRLKKDNISVRNYLEEGTIDKTTIEGKREFGRRRLVLASAADGIINGKITEKQRGILNKIGLSIDESMVVPEVQQVVNLKDVDSQTKSKKYDMESLTLRMEAIGRISLDKLKKDAYMDLARTLIKQEAGDDLMNLIGDKIAELEQGGAINASEAIKSFHQIQNSSYPDEKIRFRQLQNFYQRFGAVIPSELKDEADKYYKSTQKESLIPEGLRPPSEGWFAWGRKQLAEYLDYSMSETLQQTKGNMVFRTEINSFTGRTYTDALPYMPDEIKTRLIEEQKMVFELRKIYFDWIRAHAKLSGLASAIENGSYGLPSNDQLAEIFNKLCGEDEVLDNKEGKKGSHNVAVAIRLYYQMAVDGTRKLSEEETNDPTRKDESEKRLVKLSVGGREIVVHNLFNTLLSDKEIGEDRRKIAQLCGGEYYEALGMVLAKFMGFAARGYDNTTPAIPNSDIMGRLIWSAKINNWNISEDDLRRINKERASEGKPKLNKSEAMDAKFDSSRAYMWLPREIANDFLEINESNGDFEIKNGKAVPIEAAVDLTTMKQKKAYAITVKQVTDADGLVHNEYEFRKPETDSLKAVSNQEHPSMLDIVLRDELDQVDWNNSNYGILQLMKFYEGQSIDMVKMFDDIRKDKEVPATETDFKARKDTINLALSHYAGKDKTKNQVGYLYIYSLLYRHNWDYLMTEKGKDAVKGVWTKEKKKEVVRLATNAGLISNESAKKLKSIFKLSLIS